MSTSAGLMLCIPGINNLDTLRYIRQSMYAKFKYFSLGYLCKEAKWSRAVRKYGQEWSLIKYGQEWSLIK
jgi:hypothetical protein